MGVPLPKPVESTVVERHTAKGFRVAVAEMNGWRDKMEDAHVIYMQDDWAFFGVFDGHGGDKCSIYVAKAMMESLETDGCPKDDEAIKQLILKIDQDFLDTEQEGGSTGTMCIIRKPNNGSKFQLCVINCGDSRVLLGKRNGTIVDGGGTDQGLTIDHKPSNPDERQRIYRCGGTVEEASGGVARVNGSLAVSRGFGDADHKKTGGPGPEERPVTANPEIGHFECDESDLIFLVCDGVSEGDFPNPEVVKFASDALNEVDDLGAAARGVCFKAIEKNSKDNITCMIVAPSGSDQQSKHVEFIPGPADSLNKKAFLTAYEGMAQRAGLSLVAAVERRYDYIQEELAKPDLPEDRKDQLTQEANDFGEPTGEKDGAERTAWFENWIEKKGEDDSQRSEDSGSGLSEREMLILRLLASRPGGTDMMRLIGGGGAS